MVNPFDKNFFKFLVGFVCILGFSFGALFVVGYYNNTGTTQAQAGQK